MSGELALVKETVQFMITMLTDADQLSVVTFGSASKVVFPPTLMTPMNRSMASNRVAQIEVDGATFLSGGLMTGIDQLYLCTRADSVKSLMLFTDGEPTSGIKGPAELGAAAAQALAKKDHTKNASIYTFGYASHHNAALLRACADSCRGMYYFVQNSSTIKTAFGDCLGGLLSVVARDIVLHIHPVKGVVVKKLMTKFASKVGSDGHYEISVGELYADERRNIPILLQIPSQSAASTSAAPVCHIQVKFIDAVRKFNLTLDASIAVSRPEGAKVPQDRTPQSKELDEQRNRITVAEYVFPYLYPAIISASYVFHLLLGLLNAPPNLATVVRSARPGLCSREPWMTSTYPSRVRVTFRSSWFAT
jgi:hypothetical protein